MLKRLLEILFGKPEPKTLNINIHITGRIEYILPTGAHVPTASPFSVPDNTTTQESTETKFFIPPLLQVDEPTVEFGESGK